jgi:hypothetical protein
MADERALICAWLRNYLAELEAAAAATAADGVARLTPEIDTARTILWAIESGDFLTDLTPGTRH